jgi:hypothetical protein
VRRLAPKGQVDVRADAVTLPERSENRAPRSPGTGPEACNQGLHSRKDPSVLYRNATAPWLYAAGGVVLGLVGFKAVSALKRGGRARDASETPEQQSGQAALQHSGEIVAQEGLHPFVPELLDEEVEAVLNGDAPLPGDAYDAVAPDDLASEWLSRATEAAGVEPTDEPLDMEVAELLSDAGMSVVSEGTLNSANPEQLEATASNDLDGLDGADEPFEREFDDGPEKNRR